MKPITAKKVNKISIVSLPNYNGAELLHELLPDYMFSNLAINEIVSSDKYILSLENSMISIKSNNSTFNALYTGNEFIWEKNFSNHWYISDTDEFVKIIRCVEYDSDR